MEIFNHVISAKIEMIPPLPDHHEHLLKDLRVGSLMKCIATYSKAFWKEQGMSGMTLHWPYYEENNASIDCPVSLTYDATSSTGQPALVGFIGGSLVNELKSCDVSSNPYRNQFMCLNYPFNV